MKSLAVSGVLFLAFIFLYEAGRFEWAYLTGGASLLLCCTAVFLGKRKAGGDREKGTE